MAGRDTRPPPYCWLLDATALVVQHPFGVTNHKRIARSVFGIQLERTRSPRVIRVLPPPCQLVNVLAAPPGPTSPPGPGPPQRSSPTTRSSCPRGPLFTIR